MIKPKKVLILSFDLVREGESKTPYAIGSLISYLKNDLKYGEEYLIHHHSINLLEFPLSTPLYKILNGPIYSDYDYIAISAYIWNEYLLNRTLLFIRNELGFLGKFILGGYQISYSSNPEIDYPEGDYFISGYAEESLKKVIKENPSKRKWNEFVEFSNLPSPYLTGDISVVQNQKMLRWETKRGCPYKCSFCAHRDLEYSKVYKQSLDRVFNELYFFKNKNIQKVNIIDPIFNVGKDYLEVLKEAKRINYNNLISVQARFELMNGERGEEILNLCQDLNIHLEFGLQTADKKESSLINRKNDPNKIQNVMRKLKERNISYEISLMYGLPNQTVSSFQRTIDFVRNNGCKILTAYPLKLLKGTELYKEKKKYYFREMTMGDFHIPFVIESNTFSEKDWYKMKEIAESLEPTNRVIGFS
ncbi:MAG: radical SAM protein [Leptospiraceae bacterium]|nr:radical SAM protein [Leptospiraceae bacterium]